MKGIIIFLVIFYIQGFAQEVIFPIAPFGQNNFWVYEDNFGNGYSAFKSMRIIDTAKFVDSIKYFEVEIKGIYNRLYRLRNDGYYVMRSDTSYPEPNHEAIYYKNNSKIGDQWKSVWGTIAINETTIVRDTVYYSIIDTAQVYFFNKTRTIKLLYIRNYGGLLDHHQIWSDEFGLLSNDHVEGFTDNLKGCIIDNVLYGDTTLTSIEEKETAIINFNLSQNYPNPFNPKTTIKYSIPKESFVKIKVYDTVGKEIATLVDERKTRGNYSVVFNSINLSSGIYYYRLISGTYTATKKMIILK